MNDTTTQTTTTAADTTTADTTTQAAPTRPEWLPEAHWDATSNSMKPEFGAHYAEVATFHQTETEKRAALAARKPEDIKFEIKLPEGVKAPDGLDLKINPDDPRIPVLRELAIQNGWTQEQVDSLVALDAQQMLAGHAAEQTRIEAETKKLGPNAPARQGAITNWAKGLADKGEITAEEHEAIRFVAVDAAGISVLEKLMAKASGVVPGPGNGNHAPTIKPNDVPIEQRWYGSNQQKVS